MNSAVFKVCVLALTGLLMPGVVSAVDLSNLQWKLSRFAHLDGQILTVDVPAGSEKEGGSATVELDLSEFSQKCFAAEVRARGERITQPPEKWNGLKFMLHYTNRTTNEEQWPNTPSKIGDFPEQMITVVDSLPDRVLDKAVLTLGLQSSSGKVVFDLSSLRFFPQADMWPRVNPDYQVKYAPRVSQLPPLCGVMLPGGACREDDFRTLHAWGATLARYQMVRGWGAQNANQDLVDYDLWLEGKLNHLEREVLPWAKKYGIKIVVDLHVPPGGRNGSEMNMFHEAKWADHFIACWQRIATRFKARPEIYGFDLINEPDQQLPSPEGLDYWNLQRRAAEAIRAIDPVTPIIIESNGWDGPGPFAYLSPLAMDNVIYQVHMYLPHKYTHQGVGVSGDKYEKRKYPDPSAGLDRDFIKKSLAPVLAFQKKHNARIYVGEFSAIAWAEGAENYLADCISVFEEYGWDWTYHAFREWDGWSVEHVAEGWMKLVPSADNPRKQALLKGLSHARKDLVLPAMPTNAAPRLTFMAPFDGSAEPTEAMGPALPVRAEGLAFVDGHRGTAVRLAAGAGHLLAYSGKGNLNPSRGTFACWLQTAWADRPATEWRHVAVAWDEQEVRMYLDGRPATDADRVLAADGRAVPLALDDLVAFPPEGSLFVLGGLAGTRAQALAFDDVRIYSGPLAAPQVRELARRETVAEIVLQKAEVFADRAAQLEVKTTSPAKMDISSLKYVLHTKDGKSVVSFRQKVGKAAVKLRVDLPAGQYVLRVTDGDWFYGCAPFTVRPAGEAPPPPPVEMKPLRGLQRFWHDVQEFDWDNMRRK